MELTLGISVELEPGVLIPQQLLQAVSGRLFARVAVLFAGPGTADEIEVLAEVGHVLFRNWIGAPISALMRRARLVTHAIQTDFQIGPALVAGFRAPGQARQGIFPTAIVTMSRHLTVENS